MTNIPTDLLRTLVAVVDLRSFTKAAQVLGVTQPAVSAQIKRLQALLGTDVLDKSAPGVSLTPTGDLVVTHARRLLSIHDQILHLAGPGDMAETVRIGLPDDLIGDAVGTVLSGFRAARPDVRYRMRSAVSDTLLRELREGELDLVVALTASSPALEARHSWSEQLAWVRAPTLRVDPGGAVPLVSCGDECVYHRLAIGVLNHAGRDADLVFVGSSHAGIAAAVVAGLGVTVLTRQRFSAPQLAVWDDAPLPNLPPAHCGVYLRDSGDRDDIETLADAFAAALGPDRDARRTIVAPSAA